LRARRRQAHQEVAFEYADEEVEEVAFGFAHLFFFEYAVAAWLMMHANRNLGATSIPSSPLSSS